MEGLTTSYDNEHGNPDSVDLLTQKFQELRRRYCLLRLYSLTCKLLNLCSAHFANGINAAVIMFRFDDI